MNNAKSTEYIQAITAARNQLWQEITDLSAQIATLGPSSHDPAIKAQGQMFQARKDYLLGIIRADTSIFSHAHITKTAINIEGNIRQSNWQGIESTLDEIATPLKAKVATPLVSTAKTPLTTVQAQITDLEHQRSWFVDIQGKLHAAAASMLGQPPALPWIDYSQLVGGGGAGDPWAQACKYLKYLQDTVVVSDPNHPSWGALEQQLRAMHIAITRSVNNTQIEINTHKFNKDNAEKDAALDTLIQAALEADKTTLQTPVEEQKALTDNKPWRWGTLIFGFVWAIAATPLILLFGAGLITMGPLALAAIGLAIVATGFLPFVLQLLSEKSNGTPVGRAAIAAIIGLPIIAGTILLLSGVALPIATIFAAATFLAAAITVMVYYGARLLTKQQQVVVGVLLLVAVGLAAVIVFGPGAFALGAGFVTAQFLVSIIPLVVGFLAAIRLLYVANRGAPGDSAPTIPKAASVTVASLQLTTLKDDATMLAGVNAAAKTVATARPVAAQRPPAQFVDLGVFPSRPAPQPAGGAGNTGAMLGQLGSSNTPSSLRNRRAYGAASATSPASGGRADATFPPPKEASPPSYSEGGNDYDPSAPSAAPQQYRMPSFTAEGQDTSAPQEEKQKEELRPLG